MAFYIDRFKGQEWKEFEVEIVTPLFLGGADPKKAELRAPSIKGALRFWWRALHAHLSLEELKEQEGAIFGDAGEKSGKSKIRIKISKNLIYDGKSRENPVPHKNVRFTFPCFNPNEVFSVKIFGDERIFNLFQLVSILGGLGKRSRRGFGSFRIMKINGTDIKSIPSEETVLSLMESLVGNIFRIDNGRIIRADNAHGEYPYIKSVEIGKRLYRSYKEILAKIGQSSHDNNSDYTGYARRQDRFSSPVYVSVIRSRSNGGFLPVITTLNTAFKPDKQHHGVDTSNNFKEVILSGGQ